MRHKKILLRLKKIRHQTFWFAKVNSWVPSKKANTGDLRSRRRSAGFVKPENYSHDEEKPLYDHTESQE